jgi:hypothetical protein
LAQPAQVFLYYQDDDSANALGCGCSAESRTLFEDGTYIYLMWDANHSQSPGHDSADVQPTEGQGQGETNLTRLAFNGSEWGFGAGFFVADRDLCLAVPAPSDSSWYYLSVCGDSCLWYSTSFHVTSGPSEVYFAPEDWTCTQTACSTAGGDNSLEGGMDNRLASGMAEETPPEGLTIIPLAGENKLRLRWHRTCIQPYQQYKVYSSTAAQGPFSTLVDSTTDTVLTISQPSDSKEFYTVVSYDPWDRVGIDHNRGMAYGVSRVISKIDTTWTEGQVADSTRRAALDFVRDSTCYDYGFAEQLLGDSSLREPVTYDQVKVLLDSLAANRIVTEHEETYITRLFTIVLVDTSLSDSAYEDSLNAFKNDVLSQQWSEEETWCLTLASIALHSWDFQNDPAMTDGSPYDWRKIGERDLQGGFFGGCTGGGLGAAIGALGGSLFELGRQDYYLDLGMSY